MTRKPLASMSALPSPKGTFPKGVGSYRCQPKWTRVRRLVTMTCGREGGWGESDEDHGQGIALGKVADDND
jgi:hypothetical protein